jgi:ribosomal protein S17E
MYNISVSVEKKYHLAAKKLIDLETSINIEWGNEFNYNKTKLNESAKNLFMYPISRTDRNKIARLITNYKKRCKKEQK